MKITLHNPQQAHQVLSKIWEKAKPYLLAGNKLELTVEREKRSLPQNAHIHAVIADIAKQAKHLGSKWDADDWKRLLLDLFSREHGYSYGKIIPALDGNGICQLGFQSRKLTKEQASEFLEWLYAWCAENGVETISKDQVLPQ